MNAHGARGQTALMWAVVAAASRRREGAARARRRPVGAIRRLEPDDGRAAARVPAVQQDDSGRRRDRAAVRRARRRSRRRRSCSWPPAPTSTTPMPGASAPSRWPRTPGSPMLVEFLLEKGADPNAAPTGFTRAARGDHAPRRAHGGRAARARRRRERPAADVDADAPVVGRFQFRAGARRRDAVLAGRALRRAGRDAAAR